MPPLRLPFQLGVLETTAALVTLNVLFGVFIAAQLGWLFGGEAFLRARTGLTAAEYARHGFFRDRLRRRARRPTAGRNAGRASARIARRRAGTRRCRFR